MSFDLSAAIAAWSARHGGPRRFQPGESVDFYSVQSWLHRRGYSLAGLKGRFVVEAKGRSQRNLLWRQVLELVDQLRAAEGLEPYRLADV